MLESVSCGYFIVGSPLNQNRLIATGFPELFPLDGKVQDLLLLFSFVLTTRSAGRGQIACAKRRGKCAESPQPIARTRRNPAENRILGDLAVQQVLCDVNPGKRNETVFGEGVCHDLHLVRSGHNPSESRSL